VRHDASPLARHWTFTGEARCHLSTGHEKGPDTMRCRGLRVFDGTVLWVTKLYGVGHRYLPVGLMEDPQVD
jgi:hypothetical protein